MKTKHDGRIPREIDIGWPYDEPPAFLDDMSGAALLKQGSEGPPYWQCWEWGEARVGPDATQQEVIDALLTALHAAERRMLDVAPYERLGKAVAAVLPDALKAQG